MKEGHENDLTFNNVKKSSKLAPNSGFGIIIECSVQSPEGLGDLEYRVWSSGLGVAKAGFRSTGLCRVQGYQLAKWGLVKG